MKTGVVRTRMERDDKWMRRARVKYIHLAERWLEEDRTRIVFLAKRMCELGLYAPKTQVRAVGFGIASHLYRRRALKLYGGRRYETWHEWTRRTGWSVILWPNGSYSWRKYA